MNGRYIKAYHVLRTVVTKCKQTSAELVASNEEFFRYSFKSGKDCQSDLVKPPPSDRLERYL